MSGIGKRESLSETPGTSPVPGAPQFRGCALSILLCSLPSSLHNAAILEDEDLVGINHG